MAFLKKLQKYEQLQLIYMPGVPEIREADEDARDPDLPAPKAECIKLYLPSDLTAEQRSTACLRSLADVEAKMRHGQCTDALMDMRARLHTQAHVIFYRNANTVGQRAATRSATLIGRVGERIARAAAKYRDAYSALVRLKGPSYAPEFQALNERDINSRCGVESDIAAIKKLRRADSSRGTHNEPSTAQLRGAVSWIWKVGGGLSGTELHDCK